MRLSWRWLVVAMLVFTSCTRPATKPHELTIQFTGDVHGRLVPCGCFSGQLGGLTRVATLFAQAGATEPLRVDVGDAIGGSSDYQRIEHRYLSKAFAQMGYEALNVGQREAQLGAAQLRELRAQSAIPLLSANLRDAVTRQPVCETHRIVQRGGWRIAVVGVLDPRGMADTLGEGLVVEKMETTLANLLPQLKTQADFIVLLAFTDEVTLHALAKEFYELDVILGGKVAQPAQQLEHENRSAILYVTNESRAIGTLSLRLLAPHRAEVRTGEVSLVSDHIPQDEQVGALATAYREEIRGAKLDVDDPAKSGAELVPGVKNAAGYSGSETCVSCHAAAAEVWRKSAHGHAFDILVALKADADPNCIPCHTVGFGAPGGYRREMGAAKFVHVGCESCHGPGSTHVEQRRSNAPVTKNFRALGAGDCQKCHHGEFSRPFVWEKFWPVVKHAKEGAPAK